MVETLCIIHVMWRIVSKKTETLFKILIFFSFFLQTKREKKIVKIDEGRIIVRLSDLHLLEAF